MNRSFSIDEAAFSVRARNMSFLSAIAVVVIHAGGGGMGALSARVANQFLSWGLCTFAVPWFFFVSGYFLARHVEEDKWWTHALASRLRTLVVPYLFLGVAFLFLTVGCTVLFNLNAGRSVLDGLDMRILLLRVWGLDLMEHPLLVPFWYIRALMLLVLVSPLLVWALKRGGWLLPLALLPVYFYCCAVHFRYERPWFLFYSPLSLTGWIYFSVGLLARLGGTERLLLWSRRLPLGLLWGAALGIVAAGRWAQVHGWRVTADGCWLLGIPVLLLAVWRIVPARPWPRVLTTAAFPLYALHYFVVTLLQGTFLPLAHPAAWAYPLRIVLAICCTQLLGVLMRRFLPRESRVLFGGR